MEGLLIVIDCTKTENYFAEKRRMIKKHRYICELKILNCDDCPLNWSKNGMDIECSKLERNFPEKAIAIVQKWSDEHPQKTYLSELLRIFPNSSLDNTGTPIFCPCHLGFMSIDDCRPDGNCVKCWNQLIPLEDGEENV